MASTVKSIFINEAQTYYSIHSSDALNSIYKITSLEAWGIKRPVLYISVLGVTGSPSGFVAIIGCRDYVNPSTPVVIPRMVVIGPGTIGARASLTHCGEFTLNLLCPTCSSSVYYTLDAFVAGGSQEPGGDG